MVDEKPLIFYHFSGLKKISKGVYDPQWDEHGVKRNQVLLEKIYRPYIRALKRQEDRYKMFFGTHSIRYKKNKEESPSKLKILRRILRGQYLLA